MQNIDDSVFIAEGARVVGDVTVGKDSSIWFNAKILTILCSSQRGREKSET